MWNLLKNPGRAIFGSAPRSQYRTQQADATKSIATLRPSYQALSQRGQAGQATTAPLRSAAFGSAMNYLQSPAHENQHDALTLGRNQSRIQQGNQAGQARLVSNLRRAGLSGGAAAGAMGNLEGAQLQQEGAMNTNLAMDRMNRDRSNTMGAYQLARGEDEAYQGMDMRGLSGQAGLLNQEFNQYGNMAAQEEAAKAAHQQRTMGLISGLAGFYGGSQAGRSMSVDSLAGFSGVPQDILPSLPPAPPGMQYVSHPDGNIYLAPMGGY